MGFVHFGGNKNSFYFYLHLVKPDMRKVEILPQTDFWGFEISSEWCDSRPLNPDKFPQTRSGCLDLFLCLGQAMQTSDFVAY